MRDTDRLVVVVLTCGDLGMEVASHLRNLPSIGHVTVVRTPYVEPHRSILKMIIHTYRMDGMVGLAVRILSRIRNVFRVKRPQPKTIETSSTTHSLNEVQALMFSNFHDLNCLNAIKAIKPDLGIVVGTYILRREVYAIPRLGSINLHSGKVPEYRGSAPAFWELYNGEQRVGITIHWVTDKLDSGDVLAQELFPIDPAPVDPLEYINRYRKEVLQPNGVRMLVDTADKVLSGEMGSWKQPNGAGWTYPKPDHKARKELKRRVARRRKSK